MNNKKLYLGILLLLFTIIIGVMLNAIGILIVFGIPAMLLCVGMFLVYEGIKDKKK